MFPAKTELFVYYFDAPKVIFGMVFVFRYLFDQQLELELWLSNNSNTCIGEEITPSSSDKYLGTAYIPLGNSSTRSNAVTK